ncbi:MAG: WecB/TagA/CpsF family glycosyltransferase [Deltaproteobacteria bacterium]|nr:WecB/TagA/CpsF family glycosyltransferase [Deltaproteobacteria bacterium]
MSKVAILDYQISNRGLAGDVNLAWELIRSGISGHYMACANPHSLVVASGDRIFERALKNADILVPDGIGIVLAAKILNLSLSERVAGYDFFIALTKLAQKNGGLKYFFLGSNENVLELIVKRFENEFPSIEVCGTYSPPFKDEFSEEENAQMVDAINLARPDVLWVGMTAPKQEKWIYQNRDRLDVSFMGAIGAVFDFYAGTKKRSSFFWQRLGLEWMPRLLKEPRRMWERTFVSAPKFIGLVLWEYLLRYSKPK